MLEYNSLEGSFGARSSWLVRPSPYSTLEQVAEFAMPSSPPPRGGGRPVARRTRTFRPNYLSFAGTYQCNLSCAHCCVPIEWPDRLDIPTALRFLEDMPKE